MNIQGKINILFFVFDRIFFVYDDYLKKKWKLAGTFNNEQYE